MKLDPDIKKMPTGKLRRELQRTRNVIRSHRNKEGNARCWHNDLGLYGKTLPESKPAGKMTQPEDELLRNCKNYIRRQQCASHGCKRGKR
ncbi:hypothetical protein HY967_04780 [Candidatus Jorgensenbacteria bacterium]|nr:hypothetical protein [Candidatus Jorgensenbacteria bacterium]